VVAPSYNVVKRGNRLYNLQGGSFTFTSSIDVQLKRLVDFEDLDDIAASYISAAAILQFQMDYDGDTAKARMLREDMIEARIVFMAEHTRQRKVNFIDSNSRLQRLKSVTRNARAGT
jgi:ribosomal protein L21